MHPRCARLRGVLSPTPTRSLLVVGAFRIHAATQRKSQPPAASFSLVVDAARHAAQAQAVAAAKNPPYCPPPPRGTALPASSCAVSCLPCRQPLNALPSRGRRRKTRDAQRGTSCGPCTVQPPALPAPELAASRSRALCVKPEACGGVAPEVGQALLRSVFKPCPSLPPRYVSWPPFYSVKRDQKMANRRIVESA